MRCERIALPTELYPHAHYILTQRFLFVKHFCRLFCKTRFDGKFDNVIVVINCAQPIELGFLDDPSHYAYNENIKGALWIGNPGYTGINALGRVLNGSVSPSGRLVDTYARDFKNDPTWNNFGNNLPYMGNRYYKESNKFFNYYSVEYEEGIYVGYRYYETRGASGVIGGEGEEWYKQNVVYPLGYGKSNTKFKWQLVQEPVLTGLTKDPVLEFKVRVTNTGAVTGKDVVQLYYTAPYTPGGIEKAYRVLGDFAKTESIPKGESRDVTLKIKVSDMASYDYNDANKNNFKGYEVESGDYVFTIANNAHGADDGCHTDAVITRTGNVADDILISSDTATGAEISNCFDGVDGQLGAILSRSNWTETWPQVPTVESRTVTQDFISSLDYELNDTSDQPWYTENMPVTSSGGKLQLYQMIGKAYNDPMWEDLLNQISVNEMVNLVGIANYQTQPISSVGKLKTTDPDGPGGYTLFMGDPTVYQTCAYAGECVLAATWNTELAYEIGKMVGNEGIIGDEKGKGTGRPYSGWYAPAANIHRSQFGGRNREYYSEDGLLSGKMAANVCAGAKSKGVYTYMKHFALNDQETNRDSGGLLTWTTEQAMREIYFRPFEIAVKEGGTNAIMSSFNRIGTTWSGGNYNLLTSVLRKEWGFTGMVITDYNLYSNYMGADRMIRAGGNLNLSQDGRPTATNTATQVACLRRATKDVLYVVANSCAMNGVGEDSVVMIKLPVWIVFLIVVDCVAFAVFAVWGFFAIRGAIKKNECNVKTVEQTC